MKGMSRGELLKKVQEKQEQAPAASSKVIMDVVTFGDIIAIVRFNPDDGYNWFPKSRRGSPSRRPKGCVASPGKIQVSLQPLSLRVHCIKH